MSKPKPILTRTPSNEVKNLLIRLIDVSGNSSPAVALDASINHLGMSLSVIAKLSGKSRGELRSMARRAFEDCLEMALANYAQVDAPADTGGVH